MCSTKSWSLGSTMDSSFCGTVECQEYCRRLPSCATRISEFCSALDEPSSTLICDEAMLTSGPSSIWKVSVPMRLPLTKMPKLPESIVFCCVFGASFLSFWSGLAPTHTAATTTARKTFPRICVFTAPPPACVLPATDCKFPLPLLLRFCLTFRSETAPAHKLRGALQKAGRIWLLPAPEAERRRQLYNDASARPKALAAKP